MCFTIATKMNSISWYDVPIKASELLVNREQKRRNKYNNESELDTDQSELDITGNIINNNKSEDSSEESQLEMANIHLMKEEPPVEKLRKNSSEHLLPGTFITVVCVCVSHVFNCIWERLHMYAHLFVMICCLQYISHAHICPFKPIFYIVCNHSKLLIYCTQ